jgi:hypothetical protein
MKETMKYLSDIAGGVVITVLVISSLFCFAVNSFADKALLPPENSSEIGYIYITEDIDVLPETGRLMIMPHVELLVLEQDINAFTLIYPNKLSAICCIVPKYAKNMVLLRKSPDKNYISFRGPIEVDTAPFRLKKGEELPILKRDGELLTVQVKRSDTMLSLIIPAVGTGIRFTHQSKFAVFAEKQRRKGLVFFNKQWIPEVDATAMRKLEKADKLRRSQMWKNLKRGAESGVVVLKNGAVLNGRITGNSAEKILFESGKRDYLIGIDDAAPISFQEIIAQDSLNKAKGHLDKAKTLLNASVFNSEPADNGEGKKRGEVMFHAEEALKQLKTISPDTENEFQTAKSMITEISDIVDKINFSLSKNNEAIYHDTVFPVEILNYHLKRGDILLRKKFWLKPDQLCRTCHATGKKNCPLCRGKGRLQKDCPLCVAGRVTCKICKGTGRKKCTYCSGKGYIYIEKKQSTVVASFGGYGDYGRYYPRTGGGATLYSKGGYMFFQPGYCYDYPRYSGSYFSVGDEARAVKKVCPVCHGTGSIPCPKTVKCTKCNGVGYFIEVCSVCGGEKHILCKECAGKGFHGDPQKDPEELDTSKNKESKGSGGYFNAPVVIP